MTIVSLANAAREAAPKSVLVVDDTESNRYVLATWLRRAGYIVVEASTGREALRLSKDAAIDLVILDINLPDMTGYEVCEQIKGRSRANAVPVLHVSATSVEPAHRSEGLRRGADGYLAEPVEREELLASVEALLRGAAAQRTAVRLAYRLRRLNDATMAMNEAPTLERLVTTIARESSALFETSTVAAVATAEGAHVATAVTGRGAVYDAAVPEVIDALRRAAAENSPVPAAALGRFAAESESGFFLSADLTELSDQRGTLFIAVPNAARATSLTDETDVVLEQFARAAALAIRNMRSFDVERQIALTLQRNLLPEVAPRIAGLDVAVRYKASAKHAEVGGDFYEIFAIDERHICVAIGDVVGHSLEAATVMAQLRTGIRSYMLEGHGPEAVIDRLNRLLLRFHPDTTATVCCAIFDTVTNECTIANAGHPPPLVLKGSVPTFLAGGGPLLGIEAPIAPTFSTTLEQGDILLLFTDGLVERRGEVIDEGLARLAAAMGPDVDLEALCDRLLREVCPASLTDDIALVAVRPR